MRCRIFLQEMSKQLLQPQFQRRSTVARLSSAIKKSIASVIAARRNGNECSENWNEIHWRTAVMWRNTTLVLRSDIRNFMGEHGD
ncbi:hypothetical protein RvY_12223 [Ramazzottius varieornatus]|uniref:Uncharacterized protein n=1 Tax=Ramazzottius varieornatus TaxID=947166 RepID=A0A1D1VRE4_RAMVA|nr:hypothetical protein RvY_12223 [Ramazzottius varieornatus]